MEGYAIQDYPGQIRTGYSTFKEAKFECSTGIDLMLYLYHTFNSMIANDQKNFIFSASSVSGNVCGGITFEADVKEWTLRWGTDLVLSTNVNEKSILRSCYGKKNYHNLFLNKIDKKVKNRPH